METFKLTVSTPDGEYLKTDAVNLSLRGSEGDLAIMAGHIPFATATNYGKCKIEFPDGTKKKLFVGAGILTVTRKSAVLTTLSVRDYDEKTDSEICD